MALDYKQSAQLRTNLIFQGRIASAALKWASYIFSSSSVDLTQTIKRKEINYAEEVAVNPTGKAAQLQPMVVQDPSVQAAGIGADGDSTITDAALQPAVEAAIQKLI